MEPTERRYKYWVRLGNKSVRIYVLKNLEGIFTGNYKIPDTEASGSQRHREKKESQEIGHKKLKNSLNFFTSLNNNYIFMLLWQKKE